MLQTKPQDTGQGALLATFLLRGAHYAVNAAAVQEVIRLGSWTAIHHAPDEVVGVVNLRGRIVTIIDVGAKLGFHRLPPTSGDRVFIVEDRGEFIGLLVEGGGEVVEVEESQMGPPPANVAPLRRRFFQGVYRVGSLAITLVDVAQILSAGTQ